MRQAHAQVADRALHLETLVEERTAKLQETIGELEVFSYSIAHDMRSPLRSLQGFSHFLLQEYEEKLDAKARDYLQRMMSSAARMDRLIRDVLNYSQIVRGDLALEPVDLGALLRGIIETYPAFQQGWHER
jgi:light-regulated signal transduction histidine kinase (bacteriophytochrome)